MMEGGAPGTFWIRPRSRRARRGGPPLSSSFFLWSSPGAPSPASTVSAPRRRAVRLPLHLSVAWTSGIPCLRAGRALGGSRRRQRQSLAPGPAWDRTHPGSSQPGPTQITPPTTYPQKSHDPPTNENHTTHHPVIELIPLHHPQKSHHRPTTNHPTKNHTIHHTRPHKSYHPPSHSTHTTHHPPQNITPPPTHPQKPGQSEAEEGQAAESRASRGGDAAGPCPGLGCHGLS